MKRRDFLKIFAAVPVIPLVAKAELIGPDITPPSPPTEYGFCVGLLHKDNFKPIWNDDLLEKIYEMGGVLDKHDIPKRGRFVTETVINPRTFQPMTITRDMTGRIIHGKG